MRGGEAEYADQIHILNDVAFATEGLTGLADDFLLLLKNSVAQNKGFGSLYEAKILFHVVLPAKISREAR